MRELSLERQQEEITLPEPTITKRLGIRQTYAMARQRGAHECACPLIADLVQLNRMKAVSQILDDALLLPRRHPSIGGHEPVDCREQRISLSRCRLQNPCLVQRLIRCVPAARFDAAQSESMVMSFDFCDTSLRNDACPSGSIGLTAKPLTPLPSRSLSP